MFICFDCNGVSLPGEPAYKHVIETRNKVYVRREVDRRGREKVIKESSGKEISKEVILCPRCAPKEEVFEEGGVE